jgi:hypothetical protein
MTHYVTDNLRLRDGNNLASRTITTLPQYTALGIIETGRTETIDGITAPWIRIVSQTGFTGWCFSGYVRQIENNIAEELAISFADKKTANFPGRERYYSSGENVLSIDLIKASTGYYIQQSPRRFQGSGRTPEILTLTVENSNVYIREIDIINNKLVTRNEIRLRSNGKTYAHIRTRLEVQNGKLQIIYLEHIPAEDRAFIWEYQDPYTFAGNLNSPIPDKVFRLTTDYLITFSGQYIFDSYKIIRRENGRIDLNLIKDAVIQIAYNQEKKCLTIPPSDLNGFLYRYSGGSIYSVNFIETIAEEPFWWTYGEGGGFSEDKFYFYKGGIALNHESSGFGEYIKYVVFFKRKL